MTLSVGSRQARPVARRPENLALAIAITTVATGLAACRFEWEWPGERDAMKKTIASVAATERALKLFHTKHGVYPTTSQGLQVLVAEKYLERYPRDGWDHELNYVNHGGKYELVSNGADGAPRGGDDASCLSSDDLRK